MLKGKLIYIFLLFSCLSFGQSKMLLASIQQASTPTNLYANGDAADPANEGNNTTGWTTSGTTITSQSVTVNNGTYAIQIVVSSAKFHHGIVTITGLPSGASLNVSYDYLSAQGWGKTFGWTGVVSSPDVALASTSWTNRSHTVTTNSTTMTMKFYPSDQSGANNPAGGELFIDNIVITQN